ncbi:ABC transporter permease subunit, partial [Enterococcus faecium]|uniref:ABC transporter permease subunit n=1 Tax=Enterococcus faecium TaxID=1352 RepID=UPI00293119AC
ENDENQMSAQDVAIVARHLILDFPEILDVSSTTTQMFGENTQLAILQTVDKTLYEAAEMDGANAWQKFKIVTLPAIKPVLATVI